MDNSLFNDYHGGQYSTTEAAPSLIGEVSVLSLSAVIANGGINGGGVPDDFVGIIDYDT